ncbi:MAG: glycerate kinase [Corynebacterium sp.]|nr:glycerate kinase [Corynebacterium sp.]
MSVFWNPEPQRVVVAMDSFKGSLSATKVSELIGETWQGFRPQDTVEIFPMADGGEGTVDAIATSLGRSPEYIEVYNATHERRCKAPILFADHKAYIDLASCCGIESAPNANPWLADTWGLGSAIAYAIKEGATSIIVGIGSSASSDGGWGMLRAMEQILVERGSDEPSQSYGLESLRNISPEEVHRVISKLTEVRLPKILIMSDVTTKLKDSIALFGPQKGFKADEIEDATEVLMNYAKNVEEFDELDGSGAAGGVGFALLALGGIMNVGADFLAKYTGLRAALARADVVITGEGRYDASSAAGKLPHFVATNARPGAAKILLCGSISRESDVSTAFDYNGCLLDYCSYEDAMRNADIRLPYAVLRLFGSACVHDHIKPENFGIR